MNTKSVKCISTVNSRPICPYKYNQWAV